jgi:hypothetical protein
VPCRSLTLDAPFFSFTCAGSDEVRGEHPDGARLAWIGILYFWKNPNFFTGQNVIHLLLWQ